MANYTCNVAMHQTLTANSVDSISCQRDNEQLTILSRSSYEIYYRIDGVNPSVGGTDCYLVPSGMIVSQNINTENLDILLISNGNAAYSVEVS